MLLWLCVVRTRLCAVGVVVPLLPRGCFTDTSPQAATSGLIIESPFVFGASLQLWSSLSLAYTKFRSIRTSEKPSPSEQFEIKWVLPAFLPSLLLLPYPLL